MQLFDLVSLFYAFLGIRAVYSAVKNWRGFTDNELTPVDRRLASELAFFVLVPVGVFFHELGHAAATYQVGGSVDWLKGGFHYALFYGYVVPLGHFSPFQYWWIALAGNLVSMLYGLLPVTIIPLARAPWQKYLLLAFARIQLGWSLVGYPLITFAGFEGDWTTIYFTSALLGLPLFLGQAALVIALWIIDHSVFVRRWELSLYGGAFDPLGKLDAAVHARPGAAEPLIERGNYFVASAQPDLAVADYRSALKLDPGNPRALYNTAQVRLMQKNFPQAEKYSRGALARAEADPALAARTHYALGFSLYHMGRRDAALAEFSAAIARDSTTPEYYFWRGTAYRSMRDNMNSRNDFVRAAELAQASNPGLAAQAREMMQT